MKLKKYKSISVLDLMLGNCITEKEATKLLEDLVKENKAKKKWFVNHKNKLACSQADTEQEIDETFEKLRKKGVKIEDYFIKCCIYEVLEDIEI